MNCLALISSIFSNFQKAKESRNSFTVTELVKALSSSKGQGVGAETGRRVHNFWGDPFEIAKREEYSSPFPLAYKLEDYWVYGIADLIRFRRCTPMEVIEVKSYEKYAKYEILQVIFYSYLAYEAFTRSRKPMAFLVLGWNGRRFKKRVLVEWDPSTARCLLLRAIEKKRIKCKR